MNIIETKDGIMIEIFVKPNSPKFEVLLKGGEIVVRSAEKPEKGKVNKEIIKEFTKLFHKKAKIVTGLTSRQKKLFIAETSKSEAEKVLGSLIEG
jgi:hypothetical protein